MRCEKRRRERGCGVEKGIGLSGERTTNRASASLEQRERERESMQRISTAVRQAIVARASLPVSQVRCRPQRPARVCSCGPSSRGPTIPVRSLGAITSREGRRGRSERAALDASALVIARGVAMTSRARPPRGRTRSPPPPPPSSGRNPRLELTRASSPPTRAARRARDRDPRRLEVHGRERGPGQG